MIRNKVRLVAWGFNQIERVAQLEFQMNVFAFVAYKDSLLNGFIKE